jgi:hypothetical protein
VGFGFKQYDCVVFAVAAAAIIIIIVGMVMNS